MPWFHMTPIPGHPMEADFDCSSLPFAAKFAVAGDFDGDTQLEVAIAPDVPGSAGNDFWVMKFDQANCTWRHLSPIPFHPMDADFDCTGADVAAKFAVTGDFDGDGRAEIAIAAERAGTEGNDFWVMKFEPAIGAWSHMSLLPGHGFDADFDCTAADVAARFAVAADFDGDGQDELAIATEQPGTEGNDFWAMKFDLGTRSWIHLSPLPGHGFDADFDCTAAEVAAKFAVVGDFDGDAQGEIAIATERPGTEGNDFWVMKFDLGTRSWIHLSPLPGHGFDADFDCTAAEVAAKFAVADDFDGDRRAEIAIAAERPGTEGNDFWVMKFDPVGRTWFHMSPMPGHGFDADFDCTAADIAAKFAVTGKFDGDRSAIAIATEQPGTEGNDFWVMQFNPLTGTWFHMSPLPGHGFDADFDCASLPFAAKFAVAGRLGTDFRAMLAIAPEITGSEGNDFWHMAFSGRSPELASNFTGLATLSIVDPSVPGGVRTPAPVPITFSLLFDRCRRSVRLLSFQPVVVGPYQVGTDPFGNPIMNTTTITLIRSSVGGLNQPLGIMTISIGLNFSHSHPFAGPSDINFDLTTESATSPTGALTVRGSRLTPGGSITLVGASQFQGGFLNGSDSTLTIAGSLSPTP